jgi:FkbM family methyltransferase
MELFEAIKYTTLLRPNALPAAKNIGIVCFESAFSSLNDIDVLVNNAQAIFVIDAKEEQFQIMSRKISERKNRKIPVFSFKEISSRIDLIFVFYHHNVEYHPIAHCWNFMRKVGYESFYTFMPIPHVNTGITFIHQPDYYLSNKKSLEDVYAMLDDEESKIIFAARIRAITSGHIGYLKVSNYNEYFHPLVLPEAGDIVLDGGISAENISSQLEIIRCIGADGKWFGFEPDPEGFRVSHDKIKKFSPYDNYQVIPFGLWNKHDKLYFEILGQGTHVINSKKQNSVACNVLSIDEFVNAQQFDRVDFIKLDVEGSELNALKGSAQTIKNFKPRLAVSLYHLQHDLYSIPLFLKKICIDYRFYLGHHHSTLHETILYAKPR